MLRALTRILLVGAFLVAQAGGIAHEIWHAGSLASHAATDGDAKTPKKNALCDFHTALGNVLGALDCAGQGVQAAAPTSIAFTAADVPAARFSTLVPQPRGPPALL